MALSITKPTVGGSQDTWGTTINTALDAIVDEVNDNADGTNEITPKLQEGGFKIGTTLVTSTAAELNLLDGISGITDQSTADTIVLRDANSKFEAEGIFIGDGSTWEVVKSSGLHLEFKYAGTVVARLTSSGNLQIAGTVTENHTF